jgi:hypothetical protein
MAEPPPDAPQRIRYEVSLSPLEYATLKRIAAKLDIPRTEVLRLAINRALVD